MRVPGLPYARKDQVFAEAVDSNSDDTTTRAVPFEANTLGQLRGGGCLTPGAAAALHLAWQHRRQLLT